MPNGKPVVGEVWETTDPTGRNIRGVVESLSDSINTLVSFTGNRFRLSPARLEGSWHFYSAPPNTALHCTRRGCRAAGILRFQRGSTPEWVCPRHLPVGVHASLTTESIGGPRPEPPTPPEAPEAELSPSVRCLGCGNHDPIEDTRVSGLPERVSLWMCGLCSERWCLIGGPRLPPGANANAAMFDLLADVRVRLAVENYRIEDITAAGGAHRAFEQLAENTGERNDGLVVAYAGIPILHSNNFTTENPRDTVLRLRLGGGPEFRAPPRVDRQMAMAVNFGLLYGSDRQPPHPAVETASVQPQPAFLDGRASFTLDVSRTDTSGLLDSMAPPQLVTSGSRWANRSNGEIIEVVRLGQSDDRQDTTVHIKRISDDMEVNLVLLLRDFEGMFRPFTVEQGPRGREERVVELLKDEEWEHIESREAITIDSVDTKRNLVIVVPKDVRQHGSEPKRKTIPMHDFVSGKYRKIVRRTAYDRILEDD